MSIFNKKYKNVDVSITVNDKEPEKKEEPKITVIHKVEVEDYEVTFKFSPSGSAKQGFEASHPFWNNGDLGWYYPKGLNRGHAASYFLDQFLKSWKEQIWHQFDTKLIGFHQLKGATIKKTKRIVEVEER